MKQIIVPIDFSDESLNGLQVALIYANRFKATLQMVYVQKPTNEQPSNDQGEAQEGVVESFEKIIEEYKLKFHDSSKLSYQIKIGKVSQEIVSQADSLVDSAIILSTHGASGFEEFLIGSNALRIISASDKPVITVRHGVVPREIKSILLPVDSTVLTRQKVPYTASIAKEFDAEIDVFGVCSSSNKEVTRKMQNYASQVCEFLEKQGIKYRNSSLTGKGIASSILEHANETNADLISIMTEKSGSLSDIVLGTNAQQIISKSSVPVLNITPKDVSIKGSFSVSGG